MSFSKLVEAAMSEVSPPGFKGTVKAMKDHDEIDNPYALAWWQKKRGYQSHKKADGTEKEAVGDGGWLKVEKPTDDGGMAKMEVPLESIRVEHPVHGSGVVESIGEKEIAITWDNLEHRITAPTSIPFNDAKYLTVLDEGYTSDPEKAEVKKTGKDKMKKRSKKKVDESVVAIAPVKGTMRDSVSDDLDLDILTIDDLLEADDEWQKPWEEDDTDESAEGGEGTEHHEPEEEGHEGADYTNVPRPADSILTNQEDQPEYHADPLATKAGYDAAGDGDEPEGDFGSDLVPVDAPEVPHVRELDGTDSRHNTRHAGEGEDTSEVDNAGDFDETKPEDAEGEDMKKNEAWLYAEDLGLDLNEMDMGMDYGMNEHDMAAEEVAFTCEFLETLLNATVAQTPDESKVKALCDGLKAAQQEKGDMALDANDWDAIKSHAASAYSGGGDEMGGEPEMDAGPEGDMDYEAGADEFGGDEMGAEDDMEECGGDYGMEGEGEEYEDKAVGDGEPAGPEGGQEHEGKTKIMSQKGEPRDWSAHNNQGKRSAQHGGKRGHSQSMKRRGPKRSQRFEAKGGSDGTPIGTGNTSGSGGGGQTDLSKPKKYTGKPLGTGTKGPGGSSADEFGQKPSPRGGANNVPEYDSGSKLGAASTAFDGDAESPAPRNSKPLAAESKGPAKGKEKLDEAIMLGMSSVPGTIRNDHADVPTDADWDDELKAIKRRAGMDNWWKD